MKGVWRGRVVLRALRLQSARERAGAITHDGVGGGRECVCVRVCARARVCVCAGTAAAATERL